ncbi:MAG: nuclear transport factor 2 family protein [Pseudomonadota bacterium]|nr:nuclear transport factor 2 family protein [Pseudomonadota bacterium]
MAEQTAAVVLQVYDAWRQKKLDLLPPLLDESFCLHIHIPTSVHPLGGPCHGRKAAMERLESIIGQFDFVSYQIDPLIAVPGRAATQAHLHYVHRETGEHFNSTLGHFWTLRGGLVVRLDEYHDMGDILTFSEKVVALI